MYETIETVYCDDTEFVLTSTGGTLNDLRIPEHLLARFVAPYRPLH